MKDNNTRFEFSHHSHVQGQEIPGALLSKAISDLQTTTPAPGLWRFFSSALLLLAALACSFQYGTQDIGFYVFAAIAGIFFAAAAVTTHDAIHHTLTGLKWFDEISPRVVTWPVLWPHGTYAELHKLHHKMNGIDIRDPERVTYTDAEYQAASPAMKFFIRNQLLVSVFVWGGVGMILGHLLRARNFVSQSRSLRKQMMYDLLGILAVNGVLYGMAAAHGHLGKALLLYVIVERIGGGLLQFRAHIEHYGLAGKRSNYFSTQLYACRNIETNKAMSWLMNGLNFHSIHHAFPKVPFYHLEEATRRMDSLLTTNNAEKLPTSKGYLRTYVELAREMKLLKDPSNQMTKA